MKQQTNPVSLLDPKITQKIYDSVHSIAQLAICERTAIGIKGDLLRPERRPLGNPITYINRVLSHFVILSVSLLASAPGMDIWRNQIARQHLVLSIAYSFDRKKFITN
jgi:hypothetical protein